ncbi:MAG: universal stress protein [Dehalococcoidia bacterium]|nr:universal stress protein [Dehalococcoidia bacterium]
MARNADSEARSYLVPVDGSDASLHALGVACDIARRVKGSVRIVHIIEVPRSVALDAALDAEVERGEQILDRAEQVATDHGMEAKGDLIQARQAGHAVVDEAVEGGVDAIVIGVVYHRPLGRFELGRLPSYVLEHATAEQVWLIRYPVEEPSPPPAGAR